MSEMISREDFEAWRKPRLGDANPTRLDNPLWAHLVHDRINAYQVLKRFERERQPGDGPTWCFDRFGQSTTVLPDGRTLYIAGEHEDSYDPDFYIYNDVVIVDPDGQVAIYGYPREAFPATDFHSASLIDDQIWVVGSLGYWEKRKYGTTPVCRLELATMAMTPLTTTGEAPGWIHEHDATLEDGAIVIRGGKLQHAKGGTRVENFDTWALDVQSLVWTRRTRLDWQHWIMQRADGRLTVLWQLRSLLDAVDRGEPSWIEKYRADLLRDTGRLPDLELLRTLYSCDGATQLPARAGEHRMVRIELDGVIVRFTEGSYHVAAVVEGRLADDRLAALQRHVLERLDALENTTWRVEP